MSWFGASQAQEYGPAKWSLFTSHGPATLKDFGWWSSLKLEMVGSQLTEEVVEGVSYWFVGSPTILEQVPEAPSPSVALLQAFDEYVVAYKESRYVVDASGTARAHDEGYLLAGGVVLDSQMVGTWKATTRKHEALIRFALFALSMMHSQRHCTRRLRSTQTLRAYPPPSRSRSSLPRRTSP